MGHLGFSMVFDGFLPGATAPETGKCLAAAGATAPAPGDVDRFAPQQPLEMHLATWCLEKNTETMDKTIEKNKHEKLYEEAWTTLDLEVNKNSGYNSCFL